MCRSNNNKVRFFCEVKIGIANGKCRDHVLVRGPGGRWVGGSVVQFFRCCITCALDGLIAIAANLLECQRLPVSGDKPDLCYDNITSFLIMGTRENHILLPCLLYKINDYSLPKVQQWFKTDQSHASCSHKTIQLRMTNLCDALT